MTSPALKRRSDDNPAPDLPPPPERAASRIADVVLASLGLVLLAPLMTMCSLLVLATSGRPVLSRERRIGRNGQPFACFKFRTADASDGRADSPVSTAGSILRNSGLDELPQMFNVIRGEMSIWGPRPVTEEELIRYQSLASDYLARRPGLTGFGFARQRNERS